jgi:hypothetical protein
MWESFCLFVLAWSGLAILGRLLMSRASLMQGARRVPVSPPHRPSNLCRRR